MIVYSSLNRQVSPVIFRARLFAAGAIQLPRAISAVHCIPCPKANWHRPPLRAGWKVGLELCELLCQRHAFSAQFFLRLVLQIKKDRQGNQNDGDESGLEIFHG